MRTDREYASYRDFWELVRLSGFRSIFRRDIDPDSNTKYIFTIHSDEDRLRDVPSNRRCELIWWNLERPEPDGSSPDMAAFHRSIDYALSYCNTVWVSDLHYANLHPRLVHVVLGSHKDLCLDGSHLQSKYDVSLMSYMNGRRNAMSLSAMDGLTVSPNGWGQDRDKILRSSVVMVNMHQTDSLIGAPLRFALAAAYRMPLVSEHMFNPWPLVDGQHFVSARPEDINGAVRSLLEDYVRRERIGTRLHQLLTEKWTFRVGVEDAVARKSA